MGVSFVRMPRSPDADQEAFAWFFGGEFPTVVRTVAHITNDTAAAEDITQEAFVRLHLHWSKVSRYDRPDAWVRRVALNLAFSYLRRERGRKGREVAATSLAAPGAGWDPAADVTARIDDHAEVLRALRQLPPRQRALVVLYHLEDRPLSEVAGMLDMTSGGAKVALHRARRQLAQLLHGEEVTRDAR